MRIRLAYGVSGLWLDLPDTLDVTVLEPEFVPALPDPEAALRAALAAPLDSPPLRECVRASDRVAIVFSDITRPTPNHLLLPAVLEAIAHVPPEQIVLCNALGTHRANTPEELARLLGPAVNGRYRVVQNDAFDPATQVCLGRTSRGHELWINREYMAADVKILTGFIEPHFFAGFSGGRKSVLPGIASRSTVLYNHNARFIASPHAAQGVLDGNPLHRDMLYAAERAGLRFILNVLLDGQRNIVGAVAGDKDLAHRAGCELCGKLARVGRVGADIAVTSNGGYPLDQNVYQAVKGMTAAEACVKPGGAIVMCAELSDGHGGDVFFRWLAERKGPEEVLRDIEGVPPENTRMDQWEAQILARVLMKAECIFVTGEENRAMVEKMHMKWAPTVEDALAIAEARLGPDATVAVIPDGVGVIVG